MTGVLEYEANCGHCKSEFKWRLVLVQRRTPGGDANRERPRVFCPNCGFLILDTPHVDSDWAWHGEVNVLANREARLCPSGASGWGHAMIRGVERPLPLIIPEPLCAPVGETFLDIRAVRAALARPTLVSKPPPLPVSDRTLVSAASETPAPEDGPEEWLYRGLAKIRESDFAGAVENLGRAISARKGYAAAYCARAYARGESSDLAGAPPAWLFGEGLESPRTARKRRSAAPTREIRWEDRSFPAIAGRTRGFY